MSTVDATSGRWLVALDPRPGAHVRLICAHHAGGSSLYFDTWSELLPAAIEVIAVNLPGRGNRWNEPHVCSLDVVVRELCDALVGYLDRPYALFGDSIGALVCFEVIRELRRRGEMLPLRLFASGMVAPHIVWWDPDAPLHRLEDAALFDGLVRDAGMLDEASLSNTELQAVMTPVLRSDLEIAETYEYSDEPPLAVPITASRGVDDILLTFDQLDGWARHTDARFEHLTFPGSHFYSRQSQREVIEMITSRLMVDLAAAPTSIVEGDNHDYPRRGLHELFSEQAAETPDALALVDGDQRYTYGELDAETEALAHWLIDNGVRPGDLVGIVMERCVEHVVALIAINKAGGVFMPLDTAYPPETIEQFLAVSDARIVLSKPKWVDQLTDSLRDRCSWVPLGAGWQATLGIDDIPSETPLPTVDPDDTAFVSMSSGTSGAPKGICQSHRAAVNAYWHRYVHAPYSDDEHEACNVYFIWYVWLPLLRGASAWIVPDDEIYDPRLLAAYIRDHAITRTTISPSLLERVIRTPDLDLAHSLRSLRNVTIIGEVVPSKLTREFHNIVPTCTLTQAYGCAETHDAVSAPLEPESRGLNHQVAPAGRIQMNQRMYVLDEHATVLPRGVAGELYVGGDSIANGYYRDEENTARRFVADPVFPDRDRVFRTGDRGRILPDGRIQVLGRIDSMVKLRGYSVMLGAVEAALMTHHAFSNAVVVAAMDEATGRPDHLVAYVAIGDAHASSDWRHDLRAFLAKRLPHYAIPAYVVPMRSLPIDSQSNSKVNRRGLPAPSPEHRLTSSSGRRPARNDRDAAILATWSKVLGADDIGIDDDFFALGGHSLLAAELCAHLNDQFSCELKVVEILQHPTVALISDRIEKTDD